MKKLLLVVGIIAVAWIFLSLWFMSPPPPSTQKCYNGINSKLEEMKAKLELTVAQKTPQTIDFTLDFAFSDCFNPNDEAIRIKDYSEPALCAEYCAAAKNECRLLQYYYNGSDGNFSIKKCLNISPDTVFPPGSGICPDKSSEGYELTDFREEVVQGNYMLVNKTSATASYPTICSYRKE